MSMTKDIVLAMVKVGDTLEITPISTFPNAERKFKVDDILEEGFLYGASETCDGYVIPYYWIQDVKIVSHS